MADWESRVDKLVRDWEVIFKEQLEKLPSTATADTVGIELAEAEFAPAIAAAEEVKDDPEWVLVDGSSMIWAYRIVPIGEYKGLGFVATTEFHLWFYRSGANQVSPKPTYPYHKHAYWLMPMDVIEAVITAPSIGKAYHQLVLGNAWKNLDPFRTNRSNGGCLWPNRPLSPDA